MKKPTAISISAEQRQLIHTTLLTGRDAMMAPGRGSIPEPPSNLERSMPCPKPRNPSWTFAPFANG